jgi:hypothetical protein
MHFMNPVPLMKLVEVIRGMKTSQETFDATMGLSRRFGKEPVPANDFPGFVINRILLPMINKAVYALMEGVGKPEDIDAIMRDGGKPPAGAFGTRRPHWTGHLPGDPEGPAEGAGGPQVPPLPAVNKARGGRIPGKENQERLL